MKTKIKIASDKLFSIQNRPKFRVSNTSILVKKLFSEVKSKITPNSINLDKFYNQEFEKPEINDKSLKTVDDNLNEDVGLILNPNSPNYLQEMRELPREAQHIEFHKLLLLQEREKRRNRYYKQRFMASLVILVIGLFSLWIPLYRVICEHQGLLTKTSVANYKDSTKPVDTTRKYTINFHHEIDADLPWEFYPQQDKVIVNAGETCLVFYKARNKTNTAIIGLSVYDVHPQNCAYYFNKVQCFCFENQMLGPYEEVDLPVLFYLDPAIQEDNKVIDNNYFDLNLKYTFYYAKKQELATIMTKRLQEELKNEEILNLKKDELNKKYGYEKYSKEESKLNTLPGINPHMKEFYAASEKI